jgi:hypothetical protein
MNYLENYPTAYKSPIVFHIISEFFGREIEVKQESHRIDTSIVPQLSKRIMGEQKELLESLSLGETAPASQIPTQENRQQPLRQQRPISQKSSPITIKMPQNISGYDKLISLLRNPQIQYIECEGKDIPLKIISRGQKQITNVVLSEEDLRDILKQISEKARIPLVEGVFKVAVENFIFNAVISELVGTTFIIKKFQQLPPIIVQRPL